MAVDSSDRLSARELEILLLAAHGMSDADMSHRLSISPRTVASHMRSMREKLCAKNRTHLVAIALRVGILALRSDLTDRLGRPDRPTQTDRQDRLDRRDRQDRLDVLDRLDRLDRHDWQDRLGETFRLTGRSGVHGRPAVAA
ncbi:response regulator transcription factor [Streptomyces sp. NPDC002643]